MSRQQPKQPQRSVAATVRDRVMRGKSRYWKHADFTDLPPSAVAMTLSRLAGEGVLQRVGKGVYYRPTQTSFGPSVPAAGGVASQTLRAPLHPAGLSAANALGLSTPGRARLAIRRGRSDPRDPARPRPPQSQGLAGEVRLFEHLDSTRSGRSATM